MPQQSVFEHPSDNSSTCTQHVHPPTRAHPHTYARANHLNHCAHNAYTQQELQRLSHTVSIPSCPLQPITSKDPINAVCFFLCSVFSDDKNIKKIKGNQRKTRQRYVFPLIVFSLCQQSTPSIFLTFFVTTTAQKITGSRQIPHRIQRIQRRL